MCIELFGTEIGSHDDDRIFEVHSTSLSIGQASIFEDLKEEIVDIEIPFLELIKEYYRVGLTADFLCEKSSLFVSHISCSRTDELRSARLILILTHIDFYKCLRIREELFCEDFHELCLPDSSRTEKEK